MLNNKEKSMNYCTLNDYFYSDPVELIVIKH